MVGWHHRLNGREFERALGDGEAEAEAPILWPPDVNSRLTGKDPDAGED